MEPGRRLSLSGGLLLRQLLQMRLVFIRWWKISTTSSVCEFSRRIREGLNKSALA